MPESLDYATTPPRRRPPEGPRSWVPRAVVGTLTVLVAGGWVLFFVVGGVGAVDTHFTKTPQDHPAFRLTPWRPTAAGGGGVTQTRDAILPLSLHTLRYVQRTDDGGATVETVAYHADVRWGPTGAALLATALLPVGVHYALRRLLR
jgi:hypothetical protein